VRRKRGQPAATRRVLRPRRKTEIYENLLAGYCYGCATALSSVTISHAGKLIQITLFAPAEWFVIHVTLSCGVLAN
jgi:hypothetical protein